MNVLELVRRKGIEPRRVSGHKGGEYHSMCPLCGDGGKGLDSNRFHVWPAQNDGDGSFWCRQCDAGGDNIALLMAMDGVSFKEAAAALGKDVPDAPPIPMHPRRVSSKAFRPSEYQRPVEKWRAHALKFVNWSRKQLIENHPDQINTLSERGLDPSTVLRWGLGWNPGEKGKDLFRAREAWGLESIKKDNGRKKKLWLPRGLVIPYSRDGVLQRVRIRRPRAHLRSDRDPRYYVIPGSSAMPVLIGEKRRAYTVVETELDGYLIDQEASRLTGVLALGSASNMPDDYCHAHLDQSLVILNALDYDQAGARAMKKWRSAYPQAERWPVPVGKDPGEAHQVGVDMADWILAGLPPAWKVGPSPFIGATQRGAAVKTREKPVETCAAPVPQKSDPTVSCSETVRELGELLQRHPVRIINTAKRLGFESAGDWSNAVAENRISALIYNDPDCNQHLNCHPEDIITGRNYYHG